MCITLLQSLLWIRFSEDAMNAFLLLSPQTKSEFKSCGAVLRIVCTTASRLEVLSTKISAKVAEQLFYSFIQEHLSNAFEALLHSL